MTGRGRELAIGVGVAVAALLALRFARGFPWSLAAISGLAVGVLGAVADRTARQLAALWRGPDSR